MAKVRKKYNPIKQNGRTAKHLLRNKLVCYTTGLEGCVVVDVKGQRIVPPESLEGKQVIAALKMPHQWSCFIAVFGRTPHDEYMKSEQILVPSKYYQADLAPIFEEHHRELALRVPEHQRCGLGWIADPMGSELSEKTAGAIFELLCAWDA